MNRYVFGAVLLASCFGITNDSYSLVSTKQENIEKILTLVVDKETVRKSVKMSMQQVIRPLLKADNEKKGPKKGRKNTRKFDQIEKEINTFLNIVVEELTSKDSLKKIYEIYDTNFDESEITELLKFYQSKVGRKMTAKMPEISTSMAQLVLEIMQKHLSGFESSVQQIMQEK